ncbi:MAG: hypothetical protein J7L88_06065 [Thermoplasmata archaeon]|nr:hypothetical protein [Thermoplasmata archaeon]
MKKHLYRYTLGEVVIFLAASDIREARVLLRDEIVRLLNSTRGLPMLHEIGFLERSDGEVEESMVVFTEDLLREAGVDFFFMGEKD